jgi:hypothetical protein
LHTIDVVGVANERNDVRTAAPTPLLINNDKIDGETEKTNRAAVEETTLGD